MEGNIAEHEKEREREKKKVRIQVSEFVTSTTEFGHNFYMLQ